MRIDFQYGPQQTHDSDRSNAANSTAPGAQERAVTQGENSQDHIQVQTLAVQASRLPDIREAKVQSLRSAVESGRYQVDANQVANALFSEMASGFVR
jgi:flagellar biosynthesis anti-sigma factor FlgM